VDAERRSSPAKEECAVAKSLHAIRKLPSESLRPWLVQVDQIVDGESRNAKVVLILAAHMAEIFMGVGLRADRNGNGQPMRIHSS
jgi:hypothetical protein